MRFDEITDLNMPNQHSDNKINMFDSIDIELGDIVVETGVVGFTNDGIVLHLDEHAINLLSKQGFDLSEDHQLPSDHPSNVGEYDNEGGMVKDQMRMIADAAQELYSILEVDENLPEWVQLKIGLAVDYLDIARDYIKAKKYDNGQNINEAEYQGRKVTLNKPMQGDVKKSKVYVKNAKGNVVKVNFGDKNMRIKKSNPARRKSFRARHKCDNPGPKWKARYWSCKAW
jgi:phage anti-repressor protein